MKTRKPNLLLWLAALGIALQAIVPAGYMPAPIAQGLPFVLCPGGLSGGLSFAVDRGDSRHDHGNEQQHEHGEGDGEASPEWQFCPFGVVFSSTALVAESQAQHPLPGRNTLAADTDLIVRSISTRTWRARAPPTDQPIDV